MVKKCSHGLCNSDTRYADRPHMKGVFFLPFPNKKQRLNDCEIWVKACNRVNFTVSSVTKSSYVCSKHFVGGRGPRKEHPHPVIAESSEAELPYANARTRKKLLPTEENLQNEETQVTGTQLKQLEAVSKTVPEQESNILRKLLISKVEPVMEEHGNEEILPDYPDYYVEITEKFPTVDEMTSPYSDSHSPVLPLPTVQLLGAENNLPRLAEMLTKDVLAVASQYGWASHIDKNNNNLVFLKLKNEVVTLSLHLNCEMQLQLKVKGEVLEETHQVSSELSEILISSAEDIVKVLGLVSQCTTCEGITERDYLSLYFDLSSIKDCRLIPQTMSLHSFQCQQIIPSNSFLCSKCSLLKMRLAERAQRKIDGTSVKLTSKCNVRYLSVSEVQRKMREQRAKLISSTRIIERLRNRLQKVTEKQ